jgi:hypothetical protein
VKAWILPLAVNQRTTILAPTHSYHIATSCSILDQTIGGLHFSSVNFNRKIITTLLTSTSLVETRRRALITFGRLKLLVHVYYTMGQRTMNVCTMISCGRQGNYLLKSPALACMKNSTFKL